MRKRYWLEYRAQRLELRHHEIVIGRSTACQLVLDDGLVSRRHAKLRIDEHGVILDDLQSANGVFVNDERISESRALGDGDSIVIGKQHIVYHEAVDEMERRRVAAETLHGPITVQEPALATTLEEPEDQTTPGNAIELLGGLVDKALALGRGQEAERILSGYLMNVLSGVQAGENVSPEIRSKAALYAIRLAEATGKAKWIDYAIELYAIIERPLPADSIDRLYVAVRKVKSLDLGALRAYAQSLREKVESFGPADRFLAQRVSGLEKVVLSR